MRWVFARKPMQACGKNSAGCINRHEFTATAAITTALQTLTFAAALHDALAAQGAPLMASALDLLARGELVFTPQPEAGACYAQKIDKAEGRIDALVVGDAQVKEVASGEVAVVPVKVSLLL